MPLKAARDESPFISRQKTNNTNAYFPHMISFSSVKYQYSDRAMVTYEDFVARSKYLR